MNTKKLLLINIILFILIIVLLISFNAFNKYLYVPYNPFDDQRELDHQENNILQDNEIPNSVLEKANTIIEEYQKLIINYNLNNIKVAYKYTILNSDGKFHIKYIIVDTKSNKIISTFYFRLFENGTLHSLSVEYRDINRSDFLKYNEILVNITNLNISDEEKDKIISKFKNTPDISWSIENKYRYDYTKNEDNDTIIYSRFHELRSFNIFYY